MFGTNFKHFQNFHNAAASQQPQSASPLCPYRAKPCGQDVGPVFMVDMGINIASVQADIENCKRRYQREVWNVLCGKALEDGGGSWKKQPEEESETSATSAAKPAPAGGYTKATSMKAASTVGSGGEQTEEITTEEEKEEDEAQQEAGEEKSEEEDLDNENNRNRVAAARRRVSSAPRRPPQTQPRRVGKSGNKSCERRKNEDKGKRNRSNSAGRQRSGASLPRQSLRNPCPNPSQSAVVSSNRQPRIGLRTYSKSRILDERRYVEEYDFKGENESSDQDDYGTYRQHTRGPTDDQSFGTSESSMPDEIRRTAQPFVPIYCGSWTGAESGMALRGQRRSRLRMLNRELSVSYQEPNPRPADGRMAKI